MENSIIRNEMESLPERLGGYAKMEWEEAVLAYEEELEDMVCRISEALGVEHGTVMEGNATVIRARRGEYVAAMDDGALVHIPISSYKGEPVDEGARVQCGSIRERGEVTVCFDAMECVSFGELKYRMFTGIEDGRMTDAATYAWAIYDRAPEPLREQMRVCIHSLRSLVRKHRRLAA